MTRLSQDPDTAHWSLIVATMDMVAFNKVFSVGSFLVIALMATVTIIYPDLASTHPEQYGTCYRKRAQGRPGAVRPVSESSENQLQKQKLSSNRQRKNDTSNGESHRYIFPRAFFSVLAFRHILTRCAHSQHFYGSRSDCQNHSIKLASPECFRKPHPTTWTSCDQPWSHSFAC